MHMRTWEQRWHPLRGEWVLFTAHRGGRPWVGETHQVDASEIPSYDPTCALCPGNSRVRGENPPNPGAYWFANDLPTFGPDAPDVSDVPDGDRLYRRRPARGTAEVLCYHPDHSKTFALLAEDQAVDVVALWKARTEILATHPSVNHVLIFENQGSLVGTSNPHPHCQLYAGDLIYGHTLNTSARAASTTSAPVASWRRRSSNARRAGRSVATTPTWRACPGSRTTPTRYTFCR